MIFFKSGPFDSNNLEDVMVGMSTFSSMDRGFDHQLGQTKNYKLIFSNSLLSMQHYGVGAGWPRCSIMGPSGVTCPSVDCCFNEVALFKSNWAPWSSTKKGVIIISLKVTYFYHDIAVK